MVLKLASLHILKIPITFFQQQILTQHRSIQNLYEHGIGLQIMVHLLWLGLWVHRLTPDGVFPAHHLTKCLSTAGRLQQCWHQATFKTTVPIRNLIWSSLINLKRKNYTIDNYWLLTQLCIIGISFIDASPQNISETKLTQMLPWNHIKCTQQSIKIHKVTVNIENSHEDSKT